MSNKRKLKSNRGELTQNMLAVNGTQDSPTYCEKRKRISEVNEESSQPQPRRNLNELTLFNDLTAQSHLECSQSEEVKGPCAGVIERISLKNFKCHSSLSFNLHPYINFILGRNGSGKSAVMDAITLCLGGRAATTGRQASAKTFIKTNCDRAELSITIRNTGQEAYRPEEYGSRITIERKINKDGVSNYRLLNEKMKLVSMKKQDIDSIRECFNIQIENPVCFLNQETSKHFLNSSNPTDKYQFFMKASQLDNIKKKTQTIDEQRQISLKIIKEKELQMPKMEEELYKCEVNYKKCQSNDKLRKKLGLLMREYAWSVAINCEKMIKDCAAEKEPLEMKTKKMERKIDENQKLLNEMQEEYDLIKSSIGNLTKKGKTVMAEYESANELFKKASMEYKTVQQELKKYNQQLEKKQAYHNSLKEKREEETSNTAKDYEEEKAQKEAKIHAIQKELDDCTNIEKFKQKDNQMYKAAIEHDEKDISDKRFNIRSVERLIANLSEDIQNLKKSENNRIYKFGQNMANLVADVKKNFEQRRFREKPIGPIGMHIKPKDFRYSVAIEACLGPLMMSFICGSYPDEKILEVLINKHFPKGSKGTPRIVVQDFSTRLYDVQRNRPRYTEYPTVYEMLDIDDHVVANVLIDHKGIESILVLPDRSHSHIIEKNATQNCKEAFLLNGDQLLGLPSFRMYSNRSKEARFFVESTQMAIQQKLEEIERNKLPIPGTLKQIDSLNEQVKNNKNLLKKNEEQLVQIQKQIFRLKNKMKEAHSIVVQEPFDLVAFEEEISKVSNEINEINEAIERVESSSSEQRSTFEQSQTVFLDQKKALEAFDKEKEDIQKRYQSLLQHREKYQDLIDHYTSKIKEDLAPKIQEKDDYIREQSVVLETVINNAMSLSDNVRIDTKRSMKAVDNEVKSVEKQIAEQTELQGSEDEIAEKYYTMKTRFNKIREDIKKQNVFLSRLKDIIRDRERERHLFTAAKALRCSIDFNTFLHSRNYNGKLDFNHEEQKLDVTVHPNKSRSTGETRDLKSLSGGERSFSTVAFLLSLWTIVESPILFLDEFDVFMDQINRRFAMELILSSAKEKLNGQYLFLTPQEMGYIKPDEHVAMYRMPDPVRAEREYDDES